jgi:uncharacterized membrane protein
MKSAADGTRGEDRMENRRYTREELVKIILDSDKSFADVEEQEITELILETKVTKNIAQAHEERLTRGDKLADKLASFAGSWVFICSFLFVLVLWIIGNVLLTIRSFDPFPFILLNLILSCIAAMQAPVIMMSQNRQEAKDRLRSKNDYRVNMKSEFLIEELYNKIEAMNRAIQELKAAGQARE